MIALVPVRDGALPAGASDAIAEAGGRVLVAGSGTAEAPVEGLASEVFLAEVGQVEIGRWAVTLAPLLQTLAGSDIVVLPHAPDGRDLAPRLAAALERPLLAGATEVSAHRVRVARRGGLELHELRPTGPFVATLQPGTRGGLSLVEPPTVHHSTSCLFGVGSGRTQSVGVGSGTTGDPATHDARVVEVLPPDVQTMDLTEASRIVGGGAGLESLERFTQLDRFAVAIGGVMGATRVITDRTWVHHDRQIGTTGVVVDPELYLSFGVSGAVQHTSGLGHPDHIISVNTDPHCPMMSMSDLAIVADANETIDELLRRLDAITGVQAEASPGAS
jgi:electron transfer flavoprotein alpha subunit